ncbi:hypothetical protein M9H77_35975 [Catharanthus roseus]|uniref:Uncharacterized protein n=1 Tax=Catharanthus roseus TaxID=4058 RepID=A0ACB9ZQU1_CATRO|nr:hypothetical protein M9H77_35975 [Catharanthus roseus]
MIFLKLVIPENGAKNLMVRPIICGRSRVTLALQYLAPTVNGRSKLVVTSEDSAPEVVSEGEAMVVLVYFFLDDYCLIDVLGQVCPGVNIVVEGGITLGAIIFSITKGSISLTQESVGRESLGFLPIAFVCNFLVMRLDYWQSCLELKKEEESRVTNWGLIGAIDLRYDFTLLAADVAVLEGPGEVYLGISVRSPCPKASAVLGLIGYVGDYYAEMVIMHRRRRTKRIKP